MDTKIHYRGLKIRFAKLYNWIDSLESSEDDVEFIEQEICPYFDRKLGDLSTELGVEFDRGHQVRYVDGDLGYYIELPKFSSRNGDNLSGDIRINPCISSRHPEGVKHYSKIWCIAERIEDRLMDGREVSENLKLTRSFCDRATVAVGKHYLNFVSEAETKDVREYWASFESVVLSKDDATKRGIESLFVSGNKEEFLRLYNNSSASQRSLCDMVEWFFEEETDDPLDYIIQRKDSNVEWRVISNDDTDLFYGQKNTDNCLHLLGLGRPKKFEEDIIVIDNAFKPPMATLIAEL